MLLQLCVLRRIERSFTRGRHIAICSSLTSTRKCYRRASVPSPCEILHGMMATDTVQLSLLSPSILRRSDLLVGRFDVFCSNLSCSGYQPYPLIQSFRREARQPPLPVVYPIHRPVASLATPTPLFLLGSFPSTSLLLYLDLLLHSDYLAPHLVAPPLQLLDRSLHPLDLLLNVLQPPIHRALRVVPILFQQHRPHKLVDVRVGGQTFEFLLDGAVLFLLRLELLPRGDGGLQVCNGLQLSRCLGGFGYLVHSSFLRMLGGPTVLNLLVLVRQALQLLLVACHSPMRVNSF
jgi:hypothetical protein